MSQLTQKLNLHLSKDIHILNKPQAFEKAFKNINFSESLIHTSCVDCVLLFTDNKEDFMQQMLTLFPRMQDESILWIAYPQHISKKELANLYSEFDWDFLGYYKLKPTRLVALNDNWNAIKLKRASI